MSTTSTRLPLAAAQDLAEELRTVLWPACHRIEIAGSIRRCQPTVGDLELVAIAQHGEQRDLFGTAVGPSFSFLEALIAELVGAGELEPRLDVNGRPRLGLKYKALTYRGVAVDLFVVTPETWGVQFVIRTGPADFSHRLVMHRGESLPNGRPGLLPNHLRVREGRLVGSDGQPLDTPTEESVFEMIGLAYIAPELRR